MVYVAWWMATDSLGHVCPRLVSKLNCVVLRVADREVPAAPLVTGASGRAM